MRHFLIYSQSDQQTLRATEAAYDGVAVPGTIVGYFPEATASFILASRVPYFIDLKTPLFQGNVAEARPSHLALAAKLAAPIADELERAGRFVPGFYDDAVLSELVDNAIAFQAGYADQGTTLGKKLEKYARLRAEARGEPVAADPLAHVRQPEFVIAPYFCATSAPDDGWRRVNARILALCAAREDAATISPVVALDAEDPGHLAALLPEIPRELSRRTFFWLTGFDERSEPFKRLVDLWRVVEAYAAEYELMNLYGSYFSILMSKIGLYGFSNGIGYSEFRRWPDLAASGAAPARYYVPRLHAFMSPGEAQFLVDTDPWFACRCAICESAELAGRPAVVALSYHDLKRHFVLARQSEIGHVEETELRVLREELDEAWLRARALRANKVGIAPRVPSGHLATWTEVLTEVS